MSELVITQDLRKLACTFEPQEQGRAGGSCGAPALLLTKQMTMTIADAVTVFKAIFLSMFFVVWLIAAGPILHDNLSNFAGTNVSGVVLQVAAQYSEWWTPPPGTERVGDGASNNDGFWRPWRDDHHPPVCPGSTLTVSPRGFPTPPRTGASVMDT